MTPLPFSQKYSFSTMLYSETPKKHLINDNFEGERAGVRDVKSCTERA